MKILNQPNLYLKGTCEVTVKRPSDGQVVFQSSKVATNNFTSSVNMGEIRAGLGNPVAIQLPDNAAVNLELTTADFSMEAMAMQIGTEPKYNGITMVCSPLAASLSDQCPHFYVDPETMEVVMEYPENFSPDAFFIEGTDLYVQDPGGLELSSYSLDTSTMCVMADASTMRIALIDANPVAYYGDNDVYCYINGAYSHDPGKPYTIGEDGFIQDFVARVGTVYNVMYYERSASAREICISSLFSPGIYTVSAKMAVFSTAGTTESQRGTQIGWAYYYIPRMQFSGQISLNGSQDQNSPSSLNGTALSYNEASRVYDGGCYDCTFSSLAYMVYEPLRFNMNNAITQLALVGGNITIATGEENQRAIPVKYIMTDGSVVQPKYSDLAFAVTDDEVAAVENGFITGLNAGDTTMTITLSGDNPLSITVGVHVI